MTHDTLCPNCGYCPTCKRGRPTQFYPFYPYPYTPTTTPYVLPTTTPYVLPTTPTISVGGTNASTYTFPNITSSAI